MIIGVPAAHTFTYNGAQINVFHANKGEGNVKHEHDYNHATICHSGSCIIRMEGKEKVIDKHSGAFNFPSRKWHEIEALEDNTVFVNIFAEGKT